MSSTGQVQYEQRRFHPERVLNWGFQLSIAGDDTPEGCSAKEVLADIDAEVQSFTGAARQFINTLKMYANSLGHGLRTREERRIERITSAKAKLERSVDHVGSDEIIGGFMSGGWKILLLGGFVFLLGNLMVEYYLGRKAGDSKLDPVTAPLCTAIGTTFLMSSFRGWSIRRKLKKIWKEYDEEMNKARQEYSEQAREEYFRCATNSAEEWRAYFGEEPPSSKATESLIFGMLQKHAAAEAAGQVMQAASFWHKVPLVNRFLRRPSPAPVGR